MNVVTKLNYPEWTDYQKKNGLDPLGMQNSSVNLYQTLLPGIGNVTLRVRYYGLYAWLSWIYARRIGDTDPKSWQQFIRRTEALYALIAQRRGENGGIAGTDWARDTLRDLTGKTIDFSAAAEIKRPNYFAVKWGAYGLAYASQLFQIGILDDSPEHQIAVPSAAMGEKLAKAFENELGELSGPFLGVIKRAKVSLNELDRFAKLAPSEIRKTAPERRLYEDILFARARSENADDTSRRLSLLLILKIADQLKRSPDADDVRWMLYAGKGQDGSAFDPGTSELEAQAKRWRVYHANDLCHVALECLLKFLLDQLGHEPRGIDPSALIARCGKAIADAQKRLPSSWNDFVSGLTLADNPNDPSVEESEFSIARKIMAVRSDKAYCSAEVAGQALVLLGILHKRFRESEEDITNELRGLDPSAFHSLLTEGRWLDRHGDTPFVEAISRILDERVLHRHLWVALRKFQRGDYTFLIETDDGLIRMRGKDGPVYTNPRLGPAIRFLHDIHLISDNGLTARGAEVLRK
ncbi:hypothetical protein ACTZWT_15610 [Rhodopseudomonas sp. NSM]|uniref:hypothetical protein n=1 Tax=Rhodopseudomonas sp. NSM TaxID=3457630 RepID=UPI0040352C8D